MGTFERIRQISPYAFGVFAVLLIAFFTIGDPTVTDGLLSGNTPQTAEIGSVNGDPLLFAEFDERVSLAIENQKSQMQDPNQEINYAMIRNQVWEQMVGEIIMKQEAEKAGIRVTPEMIVDEMLNNPPNEFKRSFRDSAGNFMRQMYLDVVTNPEKLSDYINPDISPEEKQDIINNFRSDLLAMEDYLKQNMIRDNLMAVIGTSGLITSPEYAKKEYLKANSSADVWYISFPAKDFNVEDSEITENEIEEYYKKNREFYKQKPARKIKYISMQLQPSKDDSAAAMRAVNEINKAIQQNKDIAARDSIFDVKMAEYGGESHEFDMIQNVDPNVYGYMSLIDEGDVVGPIRKPDGNFFYRLDGKREGENHSIKASHILIKENNNKDSAMAEAKRIYNLAKSSDKDFADLAREYSSGPSAPQGGDLGYFASGQMVPEFEKAAMEADVNEVVGPVQTQFGLHIIKVFDKRSEEIAYSEIKIAPKLSNISRNKIYMEAQSVLQQVSEGMSIDTLAKRLNLRANETGYFEKDRAILGSRYLTDMAFNAEIGEVLKPEEYDRFGLVIAQVIEKRDAGLKALEDVKPQIIAKLKNKKQLDLAEKAARAKYEEVKSLGGLKSASEIMQDGKTKFQPNMTPDFNVPGIGNDVVFTSLVFQVDENKLSPPLKGEKGVYLVEVENKSVPTDAEIAENLKSFKAELYKNKKANIFNSWYVQVKENSKIEDYRYKYFKEY